MEASFCAGASRCERMGVPNEEPLFEVKESGHFLSRMRSARGEGLSESPAVWSEF
jgi:hypothetical protein